MGSDNNKTFSMRSMFTGLLGRIQRQWQQTRRETVKFQKVAVLQLIFLIVVWATTFSPKPLGLTTGDTGLILDPPRETVRGENAYQMVCVGFSRATAFMNFPLIALVFLSKCKALGAYLDSTFLSLYFNFLNAHELHVVVGKSVFVYGSIHTFFHTLRWIDQNDLYHLMFETTTGVTGLIGFVSSVLVAVPMLCLTKQMKYEWRQVLHLFYLVFGVALVFHVHPPPSKDYKVYSLNPFSPNYKGCISLVLGIPLAIYIVDYLYVWFRMTERIETTTFQVLDTGVQMTMPVSERFQKALKGGGFGYVCLPWVSRNQWHAFSLYEDEYDSTRRQVFMLTAGDWTKAVHDALQSNTRRPVWLQGPFPSPFHSASKYDNQILVASGIGITPALSVIKQHRETRNVSLVWIVRDPSLVEFYLSHFELCKNAWNFVFYTGKEPLSPFVMDEQRGNYKVIQRRPDLSKVVVQIISGMEHGLALLPDLEDVDELEDEATHLVEELEAAGDGEAESERALQKIHTFRHHAHARGLNPDALARQAEVRLRSRHHWSMARKAALGLPGVKEGAGSTANSYWNLLFKYAEDHSSKEGRGGGLQKLASNKCLVAEPALDAPAPPIAYFGDGAAHGSPASGDGPVDVALVSIEVKDNESISVGIAAASEEKAAKGRAAAAMSRTKSGKVQYNFDESLAIDEATAYVKGMDKKRRENWDLLYCGGSSVVEETLMQISEKYAIHFGSESFAW